MYQLILETLFFFCTISWNNFIFIKTKSIFSIGYLNQVFRKNKIYYLFIIYLYHLKYIKFQWEKKSNINLYIIIKIKHIIYKINYNKLKI